MRVNAINTALNVCCVKRKNNAVESDTALFTSGIEKQDSFKKSIPDIRSISFNGYKVHIIDGGLHADTMMHFAKGIVKTVDDVVEVALHKADTHPKYSGLKQMTSVRDQLKLLNEGGIAKPGEFVAITGSAQVHLRSLEQQMDLPPRSIVPGNVKSYKSKIFDLLSSKYAAERLDINEQGFFAVPEVIRHINELVKKRVNVYLPAGHPIEFTIKARAQEQGVKDDLYNYIYSRGRLGAEAVLPIIREIKDENIYKFNLLALSDAHVVNVKDLTGEKDYIFAAYDNCVNDGARGVFNFYPVRNKEGKILGYSFTDKHTIHYPYDEYPDNKGIENISKFVGLKYENFDYDGNRVHIMSKLLEWEEPIDKMPDLLYPVGCYPQKRLDADPSILKKGCLFTRDEKLFFDMNDNHEFIFRRCDCEGSGRPSVVAMWGSCFATINAIKRDIAAAIKAKRPPYEFGMIHWPVRTNIHNAEEAMREGDLQLAISNLNEAIKTIEPYKDIPETFNYNIYANELLYQIFRQQKKLPAAECAANRAINLKCMDLLDNFRRADNIKSFYSLMFARYWEYPEEEIKMFQGYTDDIARWFNNVAQICRMKGNERAAEITDWAARVINLGYTKPAEAIFNRRANWHNGIGEIYNEYHEMYNL